MRTPTKFSARAVLAVLLATALGCASVPSDDRDTLTEEDMATYDRYLELGDREAKQGNFDNAVLAYRQCILADPKAEAWFRLAAANERRGNDAEALRAHHEVLAQEPDNAFSMQGIGLIQARKGNVKSASHHLTSAVEHDPSLWRAHNALGVMADRREDFDAAREHYQAAIDVARNSSMVANNMGYSRYLAGDYDESEAWLRRSLQLNPKNRSAIYNMGLLDATRAKYFRAVDILSKVLDEPVAYNDVGYIAMKNNDFAEAEKLLLMAVELSPRFYPKAQENLEALEAKRKRFLMNPDFETPPVGTEVDTRRELAEHIGRHQAELEVLESDAPYHGMGTVGGKKNAFSWDEVPSVAGSDG